jgi:MFS family permease
MALLSPARITTMDAARRHRAWALAVLVVVYVFNFIDRQVLSILQEDIRRDLGLNDLQLGMLTGLSFAFIYCTFGIPVARIADSTSRKGVIAVSLAVWSGFTVLCGLAGNFWQLFLARLGVGLGEAGGSPPAHAMISDLYEKQKRGRRSRSTRPASTLARC